jgi:hypothetical protein
MCRAATEVMQAKTPEEAVDAIVRTAVRTVPPVDHASISVHDRDGGFETTAATDDLARRADIARYGRGTCAAIWSDVPGQRPPRYPNSPDAPVAAAMTVLLTTSRRTATALNLYSDAVDELDRDARRIAHLFAAHARIGLRTARTAQDLRLALASRKEIGTAIGIVMERYRMSEERAFDYLVRVSRNSNVKLRDVAGSIVGATQSANTAREEHARPGLRPPGPGSDYDIAGCLDPSAARLRLSR